MPDDQIKAALKQLRDNLSQTADLDPELKSLLQDLDSEIQSLLTKSGTTTSSGLTKRIEDLAANFSVQHPNVEGVLLRLADGLAQMGI